MLQQPPYELPKGETIIHNKYTVTGKLGATSYSTVHAISMIKGQKQIIRVLKVQSSKVKEPQISTEVSVLKQITEGNPDEVGFSKIYQYGYETDYHYIVLSLLGPNLQQLLKLCGGTFSLKTTMIIALQILDRLEVLHSYGFVYGDIAPDNFLIGLGSQSPFIFMVDFGRCRRFKNRLTGQHIAYKQNISYSFNPVFGSINAHSKIQASRRDDIQSLLYMLVYLQAGKLPWNKPNDQKRGKNEINIDEMKKRVTPEMLCHKLPLQFIDLMYYVKCIQFYEKPDYQFIRKILYRCLQLQAGDISIVYDWNKLQEIDFKVYSGEPRIIIKQAKDKLLAPILPKQPDSNFYNQQKSSKSDIEDDDEASRLAIN